MSNENNEPSEGHVRISNTFIWEVMAKLSGNALKVYLVIKSYNPSFPSYSKISEKVGASRPTVASAIKELVALELLTYEKGDSRKHSNKYQITEITSKKIELVKNLNQLKILTRTSKKIEPELVKKFNSNNTNIIKLKNKTNNMQSKRPVLMKGPIPEFQGIQNTALQESLIGISDRVQKNWVEMYGSRGLDWIEFELVKGNAHALSTNKTNIGQALTNWLRIAVEREEQRIKERRPTREEQEKKVAEEYMNMRMKGVPEGLRGVDLMDYLERQKNE